MTIYSHIPANSGHIHLHYIALHIITCSHNFKLFRHEPNWLLLLIVNTWGLVEGIYKRKEAENIAAVFLLLAIEGMDS